VVAARKALGPLMLLVGFAMLGWLRMNGGFGQRLAWRLRERLGQGGSVGTSYLLGVAFSFAFCPTLFWLFFGLTVPLAIRSVGGWAFPGLFAVGSSLPLLAVVGAVAGGLGTVERFAGGIKRLERPLRLGAGAILILAGIHDTLIYWVI